MVAIRNFPTIKLPVTRFVYLTHWNWMDIGKRDRVASLYLTRTRKWVYWKNMNTFELKTVRNYIWNNVEVPINNTAILIVTCVIKLSRGTFPGIKNVMLHVKYDDIKHSNVITDGISFMKVVINKCEELAMQRGRNYDGGPGNNTRLKRKSDYVKYWQEDQGNFLLQMGRRLSVHIQLKLSKLWETRKSLHVHELE